MMNRSGKFPIRKVSGDPKYDCVLVHKTINKVMIHGVKQRAASIVYKALEILEAHYSKNENAGNGPSILAAVIEKIKPQILLRSKKIASRVYKVPIAITPEIATKKAIMWLVYGTRLRQTERGFVNKFVAEVKDILDEEKGEALKKRANYHRIAKENEAFVHYV